MMKINYLTKKNILIVVLTFLSFQIKAQNNYAVSSIPFQQYIATLPVQGTADDSYSNMIPLPFNFDFYGVTYNQIVVSTNGFIDFRSNLATTFSEWSFNQTIPNAAFPVKNSILGCYHDLYNNDGQGTLTFGIYGTAPYRKFVVVFNNHSLYAAQQLKSSFQMILYETSNTIDIQLIDKATNNAWNGGRAVTGLINVDGTLGLAAPGRNTGSWTAHHEGWRFSRADYYPSYSFVKCDGNADGFEAFNLQVAQNDLLPATPAAVTFYQNLTDAQTSSNPIANLNYNNTINPQTIYATANGRIVTIKLSVVDCAVDFDSDTVATATEDVNNDTNLANDDTDSDALPNYLDNDDDGDLVLTNQEYIIINKNAATYLDTDSDGILNYLDNDDDGDTILTFNEDYDQDGNPANDDVNTNGIPDYLENASLGLQDDTFNREIVLYPNPTKDILNIKNNNNEAISNISIYAINGTLVKQIKGNESLVSISSADLQNGFYFVKVEINNQIQNYKFIKE
ncbi:MAG: T9SS type A sorting domain-containing protein [Flavobacterium sp.]